MIKKYSQFIYQKAINILTLYYFCWKGNAWCCLSRWILDNNTNALAMFHFKVLTLSWTIRHIHGYINSISLSVCPAVEVLKPRSLLIKLSPRTWGPKNYSRPRVFTSYFYVCFRAATAIIDGGGIFGIWRVGEEIWVTFFWAKGLGGSWF
jgi:hypothetical protein